MIEPGDRESRILARFRIEHQKIDPEGSSSHRDFLREEQENYTTRTGPGHQPTTKNFLVIKAEKGVKAEVIWAPPEGRKRPASLEPNW